MVVRTITYMINSTFDWYFVPISKFTFWNDKLHSLVETVSFFALEIIITVKRTLN